MRKRTLISILLTIVFCLLLVLSGCESTAKGKGKGDTLLPSQNPPGGLAAEDVPMIVAIGFDDNEYVEGIEWIMELSDSKKNPDGSPVRFSFFCTGNYSVTAGEAWKALQDAGHEIGNHSYSHPHGSIIGWDLDPPSYEINLDKKEWKEELEYCIDEFATYGIDISKVTGFRQPFLEYTDNSITNVKSLGYVYDCSIEEGFQGDQDGTNFYWPYTLDEGSPGNVVVCEWIPDRFPLKNYPGLWELPVYVLILPDDETCVEYGIEPGFRVRMNEKKTYLEESDWKITGFDYNLWYTDEGTPDMMTPAEFTGLLKYNLDLRISGNRAPFMVGAHIDEYKLDERREALAEFIDYALSKPEVRFMTYDKIVEWMKHPTPLADM